MAKLYFRYGVMGSSKSANALMVRYNYEERGQSALMVTPAIDQREGTQVPPASRPRSGRRRRAARFSQKISHTVRSSTRRGFLGAYGGAFPADYAAVRALPGVGDYTAGAVCSIALGQAVPAVGLFGGLDRKLSGAALGQGGAQGPAGASFRPGIFSPTLNGT